MKMSYDMGFVNQRKHLTHAGEHGGVFEAAKSVKFSGYDSKFPEHLLVDASKCRPFRTLDVEFENHVMAIAEVVFFNHAAQGTGLRTIVSGPANFPEQKIRMVSGRSI